MSQLCKESPQRLTRVAAYTSQMWAGLHGQLVLKAVDKLPSHTLQRLRDVPCTLPGDRFYIDCAYSYTTRA